MHITDITGFLGRPLEYPLALAPIVFFFGAMVGSLLNVCIYRMPLEKSLWWPGSRCSNCYQPVRKRDNIPLFSYWILRGKCRTCGAKFSIRYFLIELFTATLFAVTFYLYLNLRNAPADSVTPYQATTRIDLFLMWIYHITFLSFLIVATFTDFDHREIPLRLTIPGTVIGIIGGTLGAWPWPLHAIDPNLIGGMQTWPLWWPLSDIAAWLQPGTWQVGLLTSVVGALVGTGVIRIIRALFSWAFEKEAMGLGDADLLMMIGAFMGWQAIIMVLGYAVFLGLIFVLITFLFRGGHELPFGPALNGGAVLVLYDFIGLHDIARPFFFNSLYVGGVTFLFIFMCFNTCMIIRFVRAMFRPAEKAT
jgi:leader peptidase (prepilin peptidase)/N-methyltransferase